MLALVLASGVTAGWSNSIQPAQAQGFGYYNNYNSNFGGLSSSQATAINNLDSSRAQLNAQISTAVSSGSLTQAQGQMYQNQINQNSTDQQSYISQNKFGGTEAQTILNNFQQITNTVNQAIATGVANPVLPANAGAWFQRGSQSPRWNRGRLNSGGADTYWNHSESALNTLHARLQTGLNNGQLSPRDYRDLKARYDQIANQQNQYRGRNNYGGYQRAAFERQLDDLNSQVSAQFNDNNSYSGYNGGRHRDWNDNN